MSKFVEQLIINKIKLAIFGLLGIKGCFVFPILGFVVIIIFFIITPIGLDNFVADKGSEFLEYQEKLDPRIEKIIKDITQKYSHEKLVAGEIIIDGALVAATVQTTRTFKPSLQFTGLDENDNELSKNEFPTYEQLYEMAEEQIGHLHAVVCRTWVLVDTYDDEGNVDGKELVPQLYELPYFMELLEVEEIELPECKEGDELVNDEKELGYVMDFGVYEDYFLKHIFFPRMMELQMPSDARISKGYARDVMEFYGFYLSVLYEDEITGSELFGIRHLPTTPIIGLNGALPMGLSQPYGSLRTSPFGWREPPKTSTGYGSTNHKGIDLACFHKNPPIYAVYDGKVTFAGFDGNAGNYVKIESTDAVGNKVETLYMHLHTIEVENGQTVTKGTQIGLCGSTGSSSGNHLHFEIRVNGVSVDPEPYLLGISANM